MTRHTMQSQWKQIRRHVQGFWGRFSLDEVAGLDGSYDALSVKVQEKYGLTREQAERQVNEFLTRCEAARRPPHGVADIEKQH